MKRIRFNASASFPFKFLELFRRIDLCPYLNIDREGRHGTERGIYGISGNPVHPERFQFIIELFHHGSAFAEHDAVMIIQNRIQIGVCVPGCLRKDVIVQIIEDIVIRFGFNERTEKPVPAVLEIFSHVMMHQRGNSGHCLIAVFAGIGPQRDLTFEFADPCLDLFVIGFLVVFAGTRHRHLNGDVLRNVALRNPVIRQVSHLSDDSGNSLLFQTVCKIRRELPHEIAHRLPVFLVCPVASGRGDPAALFASAPVKPVLRHEGEISGARRIEIPVFESARLSGTTGQIGFGVLIDLLADSAVEAEMPRMHKPLIIVTSAVRHQREIFGMILEPPEIIHMRESVSERNDVFSHAQTQQIQVDPFDAAITAVSLIPFAVVMQETAVCEIGPLQNINDRRKHQSAFRRDDRSHFAGEKETGVRKTFEEIIDSAQCAAPVALRPPVPRRCVRGGVFSREIDPIAVAFDEISLFWKIGNLDPGFHGIVIVAENQRKTARMRCLHDRRFPPRSLFQKGLKFRRGEFEKGRFLRQDNFQLFRFDGGAADIYDSCALFKLHCGNDQCAGTE